MIILSNSIAQTLAPGQSATFDIVISKTGCAECFRPNSGTVSLVVEGAIYELNIGSNIGVSEATGEAQLVLMLNGSPISETTMISQTATAGELNNVSRTTHLRTCKSPCGCAGPSNIRVTNTGTTTITFGANSIFGVKRVA